MKRYEVRVFKDVLIDADKNFFERLNPGWKATGDMLEETFPDGSTNTLVVFTGPWTRRDTCRDCGTHYIIARHRRYDRIDKYTLQITPGVEDR